MEIFAIGYLISRFTETLMSIRVLKVFSNQNDATISVYPAKSSSTSAWSAERAQMHDPHLKTYFSPDYCLKMRYLTQIPPDA